MKKEEELYNKIELLEKEYLLAKTGRKQIQEEILKNIDELRKLTTEYDNELFKKSIYYQYRDYFVSDYRLVMNVLLKLANRNKEVYDMKEIVSTDFINLGKETKQIYGKTLVVAKKNILDNIDENKLLYYDEFSYMATRIINSGNSLIIITPNYFEGRVKPKDKSSSNLRIDIKNGGLMGNISCYLQDDDLEKVVYQVVDYIDINGADFQNIGEDTLCDLIIENSKQKQKIK